MSAVYDVRLVECPDEGPIFVTKRNGVYCCRIPRDEMAGFIRAAQQGLADSMLARVNVADKRLPPAPTDAAE